MSDSDQQINDDFEYSRKVYLDLINTGQEALQNMLDVADETAHPRSYEVLSGMIKNISDVNDKLMDIHKKKKEIKRRDVTPAQIEGGQTTNNIMITSTAELQKMLLAKPEDDDVIEG